LIAFLLVMAAMIAVGLQRVWAGPTAFDRLIAIALVTVNGLVVIVLLGFVFGRPALWLDVALAYALLVFLLPIVLARYFEDRPRAEARDTAREDVRDDAAGTDQPDQAGKEWGRR
jgi:multicomponent Na+:H+ antiporter subunit F